MALQTILSSKRNGIPSLITLLLKVNLSFGPQFYHWNLKTPSSSSRNPLLRKSPIFILPPSLWTSSVLIFVTLIWDGVGNYRPHLYISIISSSWMETMWIGSMMYVKVSLARLIFLFSTNNPLRLWKLNATDRTITVTKLLIKHAKLQTKETEIGA